MGFITNNPGVTQPTIAFTVTGGTLGPSGAENRIYIDAFKFSSCDCPSSPAVTIGGLGGGSLQPPANGQFQFQISAPFHPQVTVQVSDDLVNWSDVGTSNVVNGSVIFTDTNAVAHPRRFYRTQQ